ncbi:sulfite exporter TauE/SafE family protein [Hydrogenophilus hirschii]
MEFLDTPFTAWFGVILGGAAAGAMNALAGGGTFFSFPALLAAGLPPVVANATNSVALWPASLFTAWAYRHELRRYAHHLVVMVVIALIGGALGAVLLLFTPNRTFATLIPWLLLIATLLFAAPPRINRWLTKQRQTAASAISPQPLAEKRNDTVIAPPGSSIAHPGARLFQFFVAIYGGFFGAGMGIVMIAAIALQRIEDIHEIQALKNLLSAAIYTVAAATFVIGGAVSWPHLVVTAMSASVGGYLAGRVARRLPAKWLRTFVLFVGTALTCYYFVSVYGAP